VSDFVEMANNVSHLINEHTGLEVTRVVPVARIPKTTSGKLQRHVLVQGLLDGEFDSELRELEALNKPKASTANASDVSIAARLKAICDEALPDRNIGIDDNLFDVGVSSLKLVEIHERLDQEFPGKLELTDVFDHPTIAELAKVLEGKLLAGQ
jgi:acyl carrier protein